MKKIRNIRDLEHEKLRLRVQQLELEKQMAYSWETLNEDIKQKVFNSVDEKQISDRKKGDQLLTGILGLGTSLLSYQIGAIAGKGVQDAADKMIGKVSGKIYEFFVKRKNKKK